MEGTAGSVKDVELGYWYVVHYRNLGDSTITGVTGPWESRARANANRRTLEKYSVNHDDNHIYAVQRAVISAFDRPVDTWYYAVDLWAEILATPDGAVSLVGVFNSRGAAIHAARADNLANKEKDGYLVRQGFVRNLRAE